MQTIGLIAAIPQERKALLRCIKKWKRIMLGTLRGARFRLMDRDCLFVTSGMGLTRAVAGTHALLAATRPHLLVSFGIAGALKEDLHIGDVVVAGNACLLDQGVPGQALPLASLSSVAWEAAARALQPDGARLVAGTAITTRGSQIVLGSLEKMAHPVLEMETAGIAQVAAEMGIPLLSIRSVSDGPQAPIPFDMETVFDEEYNLRMGQVLGSILHRPEIIAQSWQMLQNSRLAADHAARALVAALSQPYHLL